MLTFEWMFDIIQTQTKHTFVIINNTMEGKNMNHRRTSSNHNRRVKSNSTSRRSTNHRNSKNHKKSSFKIIRGAVATILCLVILFGACMVVESVCFSQEVKAEECLSELQYKVVEIKYGDTLWSIAKENMNPGFHDINEYINEIKECNQLHSDQINRGCSLLIPYYELLSVEQASVD